MADLLKQARAEKLMKFKKKRALITAQSASVRKAKNRARTKLAKVSRERNR